MKHRNLVRLLGVILHQGLYIVMEHLSKVSVGGRGWGHPRVEPSWDPPTSLQFPPTPPPLSSQNRATW